MINHSFDITETKGDTGCCLVLITPDGERTMLTYLGVSSDFNNGSHFDSVISNAKMILIEGYLLANDAVYQLILDVIIPSAKANNTQLALTLSDAGPWFFHRSI